MSRFRNIKTGVVLSVDDSKDDRFVNGYEAADKAAKASEKKPAAKKSSTK